jgi:NAD-dependent deacetylase
MYEELKKIIDASDNIVFFGGAGVSTESNIPDFRSSSGLYTDKSVGRYSPEEILSHSFFINHTEDFYRFYREKMIYAGALPNKAHKALTKLEERNKLKAVITQNIDGLHQLAGTKNVLELHGSIHKNHCLQCGEEYDLNYIIKSKTIIPRCERCEGVIKPDVTLYEENLDMDVMSEAVSFISKAEVLIIGGTSLVVYPAAGLVRYFRGKSLVLINKEATDYDKDANLIINDNIGVVLDCTVTEE